MARWREEERRGRKEIWVGKVQLHRERAEMSRLERRERQEAGNQLSRQNVEYVLRE